MSDVKWLREQARIERTGAWGIASEALYDGILVAPRLVAATEANERANRFDAAADALALVESARGAEPFTVHGQPFMDGSADLTVQARGRFLRKDGPPREQLARRLVVTALALGEETP